MDFLIKLKKGIELEEQLWLFLKKEIVLVHQRALCKCQVCSK